MEMVTGETERSRRSRIVTGKMADKGRISGKAPAST